MNAAGQEPALSVVIVTLGGLADLAVPLPGLLAQTIAARIELIVVAEPGRVRPEEFGGLAGLHSVRLVEKAGIGNRGRDAAVGVAVARAPLTSLHENHTRAEPECFARLIEAMEDEATGAVSPTFYAANAEMPWGAAMFVTAHAHAAPPADPDPRGFLVYHQSVYRTDFLRGAGEELEHEARVQARLVAAGQHLRLVPGAVIWHLNEARPRRVIDDAGMMGRLFGYGRARQMSAPERVARAALFPAIAGKTVVRLLREGRRTPEVRRIFGRAAPRIAMASLAFAWGEARGYLDRRNPFTPDAELHEFHVRGRLAGRAPAKRWLAEAVDALPPGAP